MHGAASGPAASDADKVLAEQMALNLLALTQEAFKQFQAQRDVKDISRAAKKAMEAAKEAERLARAASGAEPESEPKPLEPITRTHDI